MFRGLPIIHDRAVPLGDQMIAKITERVADATTEDNEKVEAMRQKAIAHASDPTNWKEAITAAMAGIFFLQHNGFNRVWDAGWSNDIARMMEQGAWHPNSQGYALYGDNGDVADGAHRLAAQACSGTDLDVFVYYGMSKKDVGTLDCGKRRTPADAAMLAGVPDAKRKLDLLKAIWIYEKAAGLPQRILQADVIAVAREIESNSKMLGRAYEIGEASLIETFAPLLGENAASKIVAILNRADWPEEEVIELLEQIQVNDFENEKHPLSFARALIETQRPPKEKALRPTKETGVVIKAMQMAAAGAKTVSKHTSQAIENAAKHTPVPEYPTKETPLGGYRRPAAE